MTGQLGRMTLLAGLVWIAVQGVPESVLRAAGEPPLQESAPLTITLKPIVQFSGGTVTLGDVAEIRGVPPGGRPRPDVLDIHESEPDREVIVSKELVALRMELAGYEREEYRVLGTRTVVRRPEETAPSAVITDVLIERAIAVAAAERTGYAVEDLRVRLLQSAVPSTADRLPELQHSKIDAVLPEGPPWGRRTVQIRLLDGDRVVLGRGVSVEIARREVELRLSSAVAMGTPLTADLIEAQETFTTSTVSPVRFEEVIGLPTRRSIAAGTAVRKTDVAPKPAQEAGEIVIRPRDSVRVIARKPGLQVTIPVAEALQTGKIGQAIRVRNPQSNQIITGRVVSSEEVVVDLR